MHIDRQIAIWGGWIAGPAFGAAMMAAPDYLKLSPPFAGLVFWAGLGVFFLTLFVVFLLSLYEKRRRRMVLGPILLMTAGALIFGAGTAWYFWPVRNDARATIPIAISQMTEPRFVNRPMFENDWDNDHQVFTIPDVFLSSLTASRPLTLEIALELRGNEYKNFVLKGDGKAGLKTYGKDDAAAKKLKRFTGQEKPISYVLSPVTLDPQKTEYGTLVFVQPFTLPEVKGNVIEAIASHKISYVLLVRDVATGVSVEVPVPSEYRGDRE
jgi:hypothetical protein